MVRLSIEVEPRRLWRAQNDQNWTVLNLDSRYCALQWGAAKAQLCYHQWWYSIGKLLFLNSLIQPGPASSVGEHLLFDSVIQVQFSVQPRFLTNWWEVFCARGSLNVQPRFLKNLTFSMSANWLITPSTESNTKQIFTLPVEQKGT